MRSASKACFEVPEFEAELVEAELVETELVESLEEQIESSDEPLKGSEELLEGSSECRFGFLDLFSDGRAGSDVEQRLRRAARKSGSRERLSSEDPVYQDPDPAEQDSEERNSDAWPSEELGSGDWV